MTMVNMQMSAEEAKEYGSPVDGGNLPKYPYGLCLSLDDDSLEKLGIEGPVSVGTEMMITAKVKVTSTSQREDQGGESESRMELQITDMEIGGVATDLAAQLYK
jgi:hypothetical protein